MVCGTTHHDLSGSLEFTSVQNTLATSDSDTGTSSGSDQEGDIEAQLPADNSNAASNLDWEYWPTLTCETWGYFRRKFFQEACVRMVHEDCAASNTTGAAKGGLIRRVQRLVIARSPDDCYREVALLCRIKTALKFRKLMQTHSRYTGNSFLPNDAYWDHQWSGLQGCHLNLTFTSPHM